MKVKFVSRVNYFFVLFLDLLFAYILRSHRDTFLLLSPDQRVYSILMRVEKVDAQIQPYLSLTAT